MINQPSETHTGKQHAFSLYQLPPLFWRRMFRSVSSLQTIAGNSEPITTSLFIRRFFSRSATLHHKYHSDIFFRTTITALILLLSFMTVMLVVFALLLIAFHDRVVTVLVSGISNLLTGGPVSSDSLTEALHDVRVANFWIFYAVMFSVTGIFGYFLARYILAPTRIALQSQKRFIGDIAHELRTPLAIMKTNTEVMLLNEKSFDAEARAELFSNVEELDRISEIINNLLDLNKLLTPERIEFTDIDIGSVIDRVLENLSRVVQKNELRIVLQKNDFRMVWGNAVAIEQIVMNLLKNAINHTQRGGVITISIHPDYKGYVELLIQDTGTGIKKRDLFHIFEPFYRADVSRPRSKGGSGLGLTIVSDLVRLHKGKIAVKSAEGKGTQVSVLIPCGDELPSEEQTSKDDACWKTEGFDEVSVNYFEP